MAAAAETHLYFLSKDTTYEHEKVYEFDFDPPDGFPRTNMIVERQDEIKIHDIRGHESDFKFGRNGFQLVEFPTNMAYEDFGDEHKVQSVYVPRVAKMLQEFLAASRVQIDSCVVTMAPIFRLVQAMFVTFWHPDTKTTPRISHLYWRILRTQAALCVSACGYGGQCRETRSKSQVLITSARHDGTWYADDDRRAQPS